MHPSLSSHLHTPECQQLIEELKKCHADNKFLKYFGKCNNEDVQMVNCLNRERQARREANREKTVRRSFS